MVVILDQEDVMSELDEGTSDYIVLLDEFNDYTEALLKEMDEFHDDISELFNLFYEDKSKLEEELTKEKITHINGKVYEFSEKFEYTNDLFERINYIKENKGINLEVIDKEKKTKFHIKEEIANREYLLLDIKIKGIGTVLSTLHLANRDVYTLEGNNSYKPTKDERMYL